jgi:hypothetical protein
VSGNDEKTHKMPKCLNCGSQHWYKDIEQWIPLHLDTYDDGKIYKTVGKDALDGNDETPWFCTDCHYQAPDDIQPILESLLEIAEWE